MPSRSSDNGMKAAFAELPDDAEAEAGDWLSEIAAKPTKSRKTLTIRALYIVKNTFQCGANYGIILLVIPEAFFLSGFIRTHSRPIKLHF
jgi:hypothetical protein